MKIKPYLPLYRPKNKRVYDRDSFDSVMSFESRRLTLSAFDDVGEKFKRDLFLFEFVFRVMGY